MTPWVLGVWGGFGGGLRAFGEFVGGLGMFMDLEFWVSGGGAVGGFRDQSLRTRAETPRLGFLGLGFKAYRAYRRTHVQEKALKMRTST